MQCNISHLASGQFDSVSRLPGLMVLFSYRQGHYLNDFLIIQGKPFNFAITEWDSHCYVLITDAIRAGRSLRWANCLHFTKSWTNFHSGVRHVAVTTLPNGCSIMPSSSLDLWKASACSNPCTIPRRTATYHAIWIWKAFPSWSLLQ